MKGVKIYESRAELAEAAAKQAVEIISKSIEEYGSAVWVLAGGTTPMMSYKLVAVNHGKDLDWSKVTMVMGDERMGPADGPDNNWHAIFNVMGDLPTNNLIPKSDDNAERCAEEYEKQLSKLPSGDSGLPRLDLVWLGVGADGHTMSLFPSHDSLLPTGGLVSPVHNSPKPPDDRISLSLRALICARHAMILATGKDKKEAVSLAIHGGGSPIALAVSIIRTHDGEVTWYVDHDAIST